jgi:catechol 2,3-dioxygenase-like lactoylglutathione lyase family enzyme
VKRCIPSTKRPFGIRRGADDEVLRVVFTTHLRISGRAANSMTRDVDSGRRTALRLGVAILCLGLTAFAAANEAVEPGVERVSVFVGDLDRALTFYRDVLGFEPDDVIDHERNSFAHDVFGLNSDETVREVLLRSRDEKPKFGLVEVRGTGLDIVTNRGRSALWVEVRLFDRVIADARKLGLTVLKERSTENLSRQPVREQVVVDWDGNRIVLYSLDYDDVIVGDCIVVGDLQDWKVFDDRQIYIEGTVSGARLLLTTRSRCRGALYTRMFEVPNEERRLCKSDGRIAYLDAGLRRTCRVETFELVPDVEEAARRASHRRRAAQYQ